MDDELRQRVLEKLTRLGLASAPSVRISVIDGHVTVQGMVNSVAEQFAIMRTVRDACAVQTHSVTDRLRIRSAVLRAAGSSRSAPGRRIGVGAGLVVASLVLAGWVYSRVNPGVVQPKGTFRVAGKPAAGATLVLHRVDGKGKENEPQPRGEVDSEGRIIWTTYRKGDGISPGEYIVTATWYPLVEVDGEWQRGSNVLGREYADPESSPLRVTISRNSAESIELNIAS